MTSAASRTNESGVDETLTIEKLGPIRKLQIQPRPLTILIGEQASGKSLVAQVLYFFRGLESHLARIYNAELVGKQEWQSDALKRILDSLRGVPFGHFANGTASLRYQHKSQKIDWKLTIAQADLSVHPFKRLSADMERLVNEWQKDSDSLGRSQRRNNIFIPTERSMVTRLLETQPAVLFAPYQPEPLRSFADSLVGILKVKREPDEFFSRMAAKHSLPTTEKFFLELLLSESEFVKKCGLRALAGESVIGHQGLKVWKWRPHGTVPDKLLPIQAVSSGQMEAWPFFALASRVAVSGKFVPLGFYFEEPETHLHPRAQVEVIKTVAYLVNHGHWFFLTTHSPFIAYVVDNMIQRYLYHKGELPDDEIGLNPDDVAAYRLRQSPEDPPEDIMDREDTKLLKLDELERVADELGEEFDELLDMKE